MSGVSEEDDHSLRLVLLNKNNRNNFVEDLAYNDGNFKLVKNGENGAYLRYTAFRRMQTEDGFDEVQETPRCIWVSSYEQGKSLARILSDISQS